MAINICKIVLNLFVTLCPTYLHSISNCVIGAENQAAPIITSHNLQKPCGSDHDIIPCHKLAVSWTCAPCGTWKNVSALLNPDRSPEMGSFSAVYLIKVGIGQSCPQCGKCSEFRKLFGSINKDMTKKHKKSQRRFFIHIVTLGTFWGALKPHSIWNTVFCCFSYIIAMVPKKSPTVAI